MEKFKATCNLCCETKSHDKSRPVYIGLNVGGVTVGHVGWCTSLVYRMVICAVEVAVKVIKGKFSTDYPASSLMGEDRKDPWQGSIPERSSLELPSRRASPEVLPVSKVRAIPTPVCLCDESLGCSCKDLYKIL